MASAAFAGFSYLNGTGVDVTSQLTAKQLAAIAAVDQPLTVVQASGNTNEGSATWSYSTADNAFDFLADGEILTLTYTATVNDGHGGVVTKPITVTVTGSNDTAEITSDPQTAAISEKADTHGSATPDTASGAITFTDADLTDTHEVKITGVHASGVDDGPRQRHGAAQLAVAGAVERFHQWRAGLEELVVLGAGQLFRLPRRWRERHADLHGRD